MKRTTLGLVALWLSVVDANLHKSTVGTSIPRHHVYDPFSSSPVDLEISDVADDDDDDDASSGAHQRTILCIDFFRGIVAKPVDLSDCAIPWALRLQAP